MYLHCVCLLITAPTTTPQATSSLMVDMFTSTAQAFTIASISSLVNGKLNCSVSFVETLSCYDLLF